MGCPERLRGADDVARPGNVRGHPEPWVPQEPLDIFGVGPLAVGRLGLCFCQKNRLLRVPFQAGFALKSGLCFTLGAA